ncbi:Tetraspanin-13 [Dermatophagoides farinae]|uniref:Tetraspanin-13 n=1 Tax=Dermatophagoides farinae TaxID=6954 RepID=A0A922L228_DERFA|nr:Tetraspanin-13 [Dermatophagoides farinae]
MCGGFTCTKNALKALNLLYIVVSFILIAVATYGKTIVQITDISIIEAIFACGVFLFMLSMLGLVGTAKHNQVMLFFYMVILFILFVAQFSIACACLAFNTNEQRELAGKEWQSSTVENHQQLQRIFDCWGFQSGDPKNSEHCPEVRCCQTNDCQQCSDCEMKIQQAIGDVLQVAGWTSMFFSFTEFIGVWLTIRYRNQKNPRADPNVFL